jgi:hypothetical protein
MKSQLCSSSLNEQQFWIIVVNKGMKQEKNKQGSINLMKMNRQILRPSPLNPNEEDIGLFFILNALEQHPLSPIS